MKTLYSIALVTLGLLSSAGAQSLSTNAPSELSNAESEKSWSFLASAYGYIVPESRDYVNLNFSADHHWLHLEGRYNYEAVDSGSIWAGYNFSFGEKLAVGFTPMVGGVFGSLTGVAPGYNFSLGWKRLLLSSQSEYFIDSEESSGNYFYTWSELSWSPWEWLRVGYAAQRTKAYQSSLDIQRGFLAGVIYRRIDFTTYVFNLGWTDPTVVLALGFNF